MRHFFWFSLLILSSLQVEAQISWKLKDSDRKAKTVHGNSNTDFVESGFAIYQAKSTFTFHVDKGSTTPYALEKTEITILGLLDYEKFTSVVYTDSSSVLQSLYILDKKGSKQSMAYITLPYKNDFIFHNDGMYNLVSLPNSTYGEVMQYEYTIKHTDLRYLATHYFQDRYLILEGEVQIDVPEWLDMEIKEFNFQGYGISKKTEKPSASKRKKKGEKEEEVPKMRYIYSYKELEPSLNEPNMPGPSHIMPHLMFMFKELDFGNGPKITMMKETLDLYKWYKSLLDSVSNDSSEIYPIYQQIVKDAPSKEDKLKAIFYWLQENIRYVAFEDGLAGYKPEAAHKVCKDRYGDCKGMANLAKELYIMAGFDARLTWLGTKRVAYDYSYPNLAVDNHAICTVIDGDKKYFLDITESYIAIDDYAERIQGRPVMIENGNTYLIDTVPVAESKTNMIQLTNGFTLSGTKMVGKAVHEYHGESKTDVLRSYNNIRSQNKAEALEKYLSSNDKNFIVSAIKASDFTERSTPLKLEYDFELSNQVLFLNEKYFIPLDRTKSFYFLDFEPTRKTDYELGQKYYKDVANSFFMPTGWKVVHLPEGFSVEREDYTIKIEIVVEGNLIKYQRIINIPKGRIQKKNQAQWNTDIRQLRAVYDDFLVIEKI